MNAFFTLHKEISNIEKETSELKKLIGNNNLSEEEKQRIFKWGNTVRSMMNMVGIDEKTQEDFNKLFKSFTEKLSWLISITEGVLPIFKTYYEEKSHRPF